MFHWYFINDHHNIRHMYDHISSHGSCSSLAIMIMNHDGELKLENVNGAGRREPEIVSTFMPAALQYLPMSNK